MTLRPETQLRTKAIDRSMICELIEFGDQTGLSQWSAQNYLDEIALDSSEMYCVLDDNGAILAFVVGRLVPGKGIDETIAEIYNFAVRPYAMGTGLAAQLLTFFIDTVSSKNATSIWLEVRESNRRAIGFYQKFGFEIVTRRDGYYTAPRENALVMLLKLK